jgi:dTDP-L-rhamnose 4-epimerase
MNQKPLVLITGGAGFIGSHLSRILIENGYKIRILDPLTAQVHGEVPRSLDWLEAEGIEFIRASVNSRKDMEVALSGVDYIVHLAAETGTGQSMYEIEHYYEVNCQGTALLFDVLANNVSHTVKRIVLASSRSVYGEGAYTCTSCDKVERITPEPRLAEQLLNESWEPLCPFCSSPLKVEATTETDAIRPASMYASSKYAQEDIVRIGCGSLGIGYAILRLQNVYGEGQSLNNPYTGILSIFSTRIRRGLNLPIFEDGKESRDFIHVEDVARVMHKCISTDKSPDDVFNVGSGIASSVIDVATQLSLGLDAEPNLEVTGQYRIGDIRHNRADTNSLINVLGYQPQITLEQGMRRFADWVKQQPLPEDKLAKTFDELKARNLMG